MKRKTVCLLALTLILLLVFPVCAEQNTGDDDSMEIILPEWLDDMKEPISSLSSWFDEKGLQITPQGNYTLITMMGNPKTGKEVKEVKVPSSIRITETTDGTEEGYKQVTATITEDLSVTKGGNRLLGWYSAFDRNTGISFESAGKEAFKARVETDFSDAVYPTGTIRITVTCPKDYDGTVFQVGYENIAMNTSWHQNTPQGASYRIDELPYFDTNGHKYFYFSYNQ